MQQVALWCGSVLCVGQLGGFRGSEFAVCGFIVCVCVYGRVWSGFVGVSVQEVVLCCVFLCCVLYTLWVLGS